MERFIQEKKQDLKNKKWDFHKYKRRKMISWGLGHGKVFPYSDPLIEKFRKVYYGGVPASIILLSDSITNGYCYDRALLASRAFLDDENVDVKLIYATVDSLRLNPEFESDDPLHHDHCVVEITLNGKQYIIDTTDGFVFDKQYYWMLERPNVRHVNSKESIIKFLEEDEEFHPDDLENDKYALPVILPNIELVYGRPNEMYAMMGIELLQREIEHYKKVIHYDEIVREVNEDMKAKGFDLFDPTEFVSIFSKQKKPNSH